MSKLRTVASRRCSSTELGFQSTAGSRHGGASDFRWAMFWPSRSRWGHRECPLLSHDLLARPLRAGRRRPIHNKSALRSMITLTIPVAVPPTWGVSVKRAATDVCTAVTLLASMRESRGAVGGDFFRPEAIARTKQGDVSEEVKAMTSDSTGLQAQSQPEMARSPISAVRLRILCLPYRSVDVGEASRSSTGPSSPRP